MGKVEAGQQWPRCSGRQDRADAARAARAGRVEAGDRGARGALSLAGRQPQREAPAQPAENAAAESILL